MLDPFKPYLLRRTAEGVWNTPRLLQELRAQGYPGGATILKDFLQPLRPPRQPIAVLRYEPGPGEQAQVDFGSFPYDEGGTSRRLWAFVLVLSYPRAMYVDFVERTDLATLLACHRRAFAALGGVPRQVLYDNLKAVVLGRDPDGTPRFHPAFLDFALLCGLAPQVCRPYRAQTKGRWNEPLATSRRASSRDAAIATWTT